MTILFPVSMICWALLIWFYGRKYVVRKTLDIMDLTLLLFVLMFVFRPLLLLLRIDQPWISEYVTNEELNWVIGVALFHICLWMMIMFVFAKIGYKLTKRPWLSHRKFHFTFNQMVLAALILFAIAAILLIPQIDLVGGIADFTAESKLGRNSEDLVDRWKRYPAIFGTIWAASAFILMRQNSTGESKTKLNTRFMLTFSFFLYLACASISFIYGARDTMVFGLLAILASPLRGSRINSRILIKFGAIALFILLFSASFRYIRDTLISAELSALLTGELSIVRSLSLATNLVFFDSLMLLIRDFPETFPYFGQFPFVEGLRKLPFGQLVFGARDTEFGNLAQETVRLYYPWRRNGNPITAIGDWYVCFGLAGIIVGSALSGIVLGWLQKKLSLFDQHPMLFVISVFLVTNYVLFGIWARTSHLAFYFVACQLLIVLGMFLLKKLGKSYH